MTRKPIVVIGDLALIPFVHSDDVFTVRLGSRDPTDQVFTYQALNEDDSPAGAMIHVAVGKLRREIARNPRAFRQKEYAVVPEQAVHVIEHNGVEMGHLDRLSERAAEHPGILLEWNDGTETIVDGNHRYVKRWQLGKETMWFTIVTEEQIKPFLLDFPDELVPK